MKIDNKKKELIRHTNQVSTCEINNDKCYNKLANVIGFNSIA